MKLIALLVVLISVTLWLWLDDRWYLMGENIQVVGTTADTTAFDIAVASDLLGWHGFRLRPQAAEGLIVEKVKAVTGAQVECSRFPANCVIRVTERTPVLNWVTEGATYWIDSTGTLFPAQSVRADLPVVNGPMPVLDDSQTLLPVVEGAKALIAMGIALDKLEYNVERGLVWTDPEGRRIAFGTGADMEPRWRIYEALVEHLEARNVFPWAIDVRFPEGPTYSLERLY
jgi:cell division septal protein FtsQ